MIVLLYHCGLARHDLCRHQYYDNWDINVNYYLQLLSAFHLSSHFAMFLIIGKISTSLFTHPHHLYLLVLSSQTQSLQQACYCRSPLTTSLLSPMLPLLSWLIVDYILSLSPQVGTSPVDSSAAARQHGRLIALY